MIPRRNHGSEVLFRSSQVSTHALAMPEPRQIVVVEDLFVRQFLQTALQRMGHHVTCAMPVEAARLIHQGGVDLLVTNSPATFAEFGDTVPLLYLAAFPDPSMAASFRRWIPLRKPFQTSELRASIDQLFAEE